MNGTGSLIMRADKVGADTMLARIVAMVSEAQRSRAPIQALADKVSGYFVPAVLGIAVLAFVAWAALGPSPGAFLCADRGGLRRHHRLSLRAWPRHPDVDRRGDRQGRGRRCADQVG